MPRGEAGAADELAMPTCPCWPRSWPSGRAPGLRAGAGPRAAPGRAGDRRLVGGMPATAGRTGQIRVVFTFKTSDFPSKSARKTRCFHVLRISGDVKTVGTSGDSGDTLISLGFFVPNLSPLVKTVGTNSVQRSAITSDPSPGPFFSGAKCGQLREFAARKTSARHRLTAAPRSLTDRGRIWQAEPDSTDSARRRAAGVCNRRCGPCRVSGTHAPAARVPPPGDRSLGIRSP